MFRLETFDDSRTQTKSDIEYRTFMDGNFTSIETSQTEISSEYGINNPNSHQYHTLSESIVFIGIGKYHYMLLGCICINYFVATMMYNITPFILILSQLNEDNQRDYILLIVFIVSIFIANVIVIYIGKYSDKYGRKKVILYSSIILFISSILSVILSTKYIVLIMVNTITIISSLLLVVSLLILLIEYLPYKNRFHFIIFVFIMGKLSFIMMNVTSIIIVKTDTNPNSKWEFYRYLILICSVFTVILPILNYFKIKESLHFLHFNGDKIELKNLLNRIYETNKNSLFQIKSKLETLDIVKPKLRGNIRDIFRYDFNLALILSISIFFLAPIYENLITIQLKLFEYYMDAEVSLLPKLKLTLSFYGCDFIVLVIMMITLKHIDRTKIIKFGVFCSFMFLLGLVLLCFMSVNNKLILLASLMVTFIIRFFIQMVFFLLILYIIELYPTVIRNISGIYYTIIAYFGDIFFKVALNIDYETQNRSIFTKFYHTTIFDDLIVFNITSFICFILLFFGLKIETRNMPIQDILTINKHVKKHSLNDIDYHYTAMDDDL